MEKKLFSLKHLAPVSVANCATRRRKRCRFTGQVCMYSSCDFFVCALGGVRLCRFHENERGRFLPRKFFKQSDGA